MGDRQLSLLVLGPFQLAIDGTPVTVARTKTRLTLIVLALHGNEPVAVDHLVDLLWDESPPASARANLRNYLTEAHRLLPARADGRPRLERAPGRVTLHVDPDELDVLRFAAELAAARRHRDEGAGRLAVDAYQRALDCWRGPAAGGPDATGPVGAQLDLLDSARLDAYDECVQLKLTLGAEPGDLTVLRETLARHPYRERTCANLMTALYRAGQAAEALELYRRTERALRDDLGVNPAPELERLHQAVLRHDPALAGTTTVPLRRGPWQALPLPSPFVPRPAEFDAATAGLATGPAVVLHGLAGAGKSALATAIAHARRPDFPDGCLYANLNGADARLPPATPRDVIARFLRALAVPGPVPADLDEAAAALRSHLAGRRILLVLDNAGSAEQVRPLLPADPSCAVVVTSRRTLATLDAAHVAVGKLPDAEALVLMTRLLGEERAATDPDALRRLVRACGHLPLALRIAASRLISRPDWRLRELADRLESEHRRLDELQADDLDVRAGFLVSHAALAAEPAAATAVLLFRRLGQVDAADVTAAAAAALLDRDEHTAERAADRLCRDHLLERSGPDRYRCHDLLRIFAREQAALSPGDDRDGAVRRLLLWYSGVLLGANRVLYPGRYQTPERAAATFAHRDDALRWLEAERDNIIAMLRHAGGEARPLVLALAIDLGPFLNSWGHWPVLSEVAALALRLAEELGDDRARADAYGQLGSARLRAGDEAGGGECFARALELYRALGDRTGECRSLNNLAIYHRRLGDYGTAVAHLHEVIEVRRQIGDRRGEATALDNLGLIYQSMGHYPEAIAAHEEGRRLVQRLGDPSLEALIVLNLGETVRLAARPGDAADLLREATKLARETGNRAAAAEALTSLAKVLAGQGLDREAEACRREAALLTSDG
ncbi:AfsR/SARP family transcriptional regulator [Paractinoplanes rishiriensis]|uniref:SARP family transcriptional regulator n=1 Tax=Paractinoplanes rishiriensis TaxID=1050105 RepID=A0A919JSN8_9ACTN|nr:BTAD domain-containing putative transcriptional regulator [Actinoplanes rishiriensis]GIE92729.1 SARP family transcriptional regulator [Actinoplanes rishiriensis]